MTNDINIRIVRALYFRGNTNWNYHRLLYPHNTLYIVLGGNGHIRYNGTVTDMLPGHAYLIPLRHQHDLWCDTHVEKVYADVHVELFPGYDVFADTNQIPSLSLGLEHCMRLRNLYDGGVREHLELRGELEIILARFMTDEPKSVSAKMISLLPVITEIQQNLSSQIRRQNLAEKFGWNPTVLSRTFKQVFGCGIKQYAENLLTARLVEEILLTDKTLQQLAEEYGFCDSYYLSAFFKRNTGMSPIIYRQIQQQQTHNNH